MGTAIAQYTFQVVDASNTILTLLFGGGVHSKLLKRDASSKLLLRDISSKLLLGHQ